MRPSMELPKRWRTKWPFSGIPAVLEDNCWQMTRIPTGTHCGFIQLIVVSWKFEPKQAGAVGLPPNTSYHGTDSFFMRSQTH